MKLIKKIKIPEIDCEAIDRRGFKKWCLLIIIEDKDALIKDFRLRFWVMTKLG